MIVIYNFSGLLVGLLGIVILMAAAVVTGSAGFGLLLGGLTWVAAGFWWRSRVKPGEPKNPYPAVFFIPLPFIGIAIALAAIPTIFVDMRRASLPVDPRAAQFKTDEDFLRKPTLGGNGNLSAAVHKAITADDLKSTVNVTTHVKNDRVLVLAQISHLKDYDKEARKKLLADVLKAVIASPDGKGKTAFVGIKGRTLYGIVHVPQSITQIGESVKEEALYDFYGPAQPAVQSTATTTK